MEDPYTLAYILAKLTVFIRRLFGGTKDSIEGTGSESAPISFDEPVQQNQAKAIEASRPGKTAIGRAATAGAWAGILSAILSLILLPLILYSVLILSHENLSDFEGIEYVMAFFLCSPYPLLGAAVGAVIGYLRAKKVVSIGDDTGVIRYARIGGGIAGLLIGIVPYLLIWIVVLWNR